MKEQRLVVVEHGYKRNDNPPELIPNVIDSTLFLDSDGNKVGFYLRSLPNDVNDVLGYCNKELRSKRVPKSTMYRHLPLGTKSETGAWEYSSVEQESVIIGAVPAKPHQRRPFNSISQVHLKSSASAFIKGMIVLAKLSENLIKDIMPEQYFIQKKTIEENVLKKFRFGDLFTSSISNYNIAANYHQDNRNLKNTVNVIYSKKENANGGNLHVPDYDLVFDNVDGSMICYPAWANLHGVTPILPTKKGGYRNSIVFYPLGGLHKE